MSSIFKIVKLSHKKEAKQKSSYFTTEKIRKRVYVNTLASLAFKEFLEDNNFKVNEGESYLDNFQLAEVLDVSDLKIDSLRIDCRCIVDSEYKQIWIPKKPYEFGYIFDFYIALRFETNTNRIEIIGYVSQELLNKSIENTESNQNYYILDASVLKPIQDLPEAIFIGLNYLKEAKVFQEEDHNIVIEKIPDYFDNELSAREKMLFQKHLVECDDCKENLLYYYLFTNKLKQIPDLGNLIIEKAKDVEPEAGQESQDIRDNSMLLPPADSIINDSQQHNIPEPASFEDIQISQEDYDPTSFEDIQISQEDYDPTSFEDIQISQEDYDPTSLEDIQISQEDYDPTSFEDIQISQEDYDPTSLEDIQIPQEDYEPASFEDIQIPCDECQQPQICEDYIQQESEIFEYDNQLESLTDNNWQDEQVYFEDAMTSDDSIYEHLGLSKTNYEQFNGVETIETEDITDNKQEDNNVETINIEFVPLEDNLENDNVETIIPQQPTASYEGYEEYNADNTVIDSVSIEEPVEDYHQSFEQSKPITFEEDLSANNYQNLQESTIKDNTDILQPTQEYKTDDFIPTDAEISDLEQFVKARKETAIQKRKKKFNALPLLLVASIAAAGGILIFKGQIVMPQLANVSDNLKRYIATGMDSIKFGNEKNVTTKEIAKVPSSEILSDDEMTKFTDGTYLSDPEKDTNKATEEKVEDVSTPEIKKENLEVKEITNQKMNEEIKSSAIPEKTTEKVKNTDGKKQVAPQKTLEVPKKTIEKATVIKAKEEKKSKEEQIKGQKAITKINIPKETDKKTPVQISKKEKPLLASNLPAAFVAPRGLSAPGAAGGVVHSKQNEPPRISQSPPVVVQKAKEREKSDNSKMTESLAVSSFAAGESVRKQSKKDVSQNDNLLSALSEKKESIKLGFNKTDTSVAHKFTPVNVSWKPSTSQQIDSNLKSFINSATQNTKSTLNTDLKNNEIPLLSRSTVVTVKINNYKKSVIPQISVSSGSSRVDNIILNSVKKGFSGSSLPKDITSSEPVEIKVTVAQ